MTGSYITLMIKISKHYTKETMKWSEDQNIKELGVFNRITIGGRRLWHRGAMAPPNISFFFFAFFFFI